MSNYYKYVKVRFGIALDSYKLPTGNAEGYWFKAYEPLVPGDMVVVEVRDTFTLATVLDVAPMPVGFTGQVTKAVLSKINTNAYTHGKQMDEQRKELKKRMDERVKALQEDALYEMLAEKDPELKSMLEAYREVQ